MDTVHSPQRVWLNLKRDDLWECLRHGNTFAQCLTEKYTPAKSTESRNHFSNSMLSLIPNYANV